VPSGSACVDAGLSSVGSSKITLSAVEAPGCHAADTQTARTAVCCLP
jgi:hypothetical protein